MKNTIFSIFWNARQIAIGTFMCEQSSARDYRKRSGCLSNVLVNAIPNGFRLGTFVLFNMLVHSYGILWNGFGTYFSVNQMNINNFVLYEQSKLCTLRILEIFLIGFLITPWTVERSTPACFKWDAGTSSIWALLNGEPCGEPWTASYTAPPILVVTWSVNEYECRIFDSLICSS